MPLGTTLDQLDGSTVIPEKPEELEKFVQGQALGPSAAAAPLVPLHHWPGGVSVLSVLSPALAKRLAATGIDLDPSNMVRITIGELLILPKFGVASVIQLGREIEAGIVNAVGRSTIADGEASGDARANVAAPERRRPDLGAEPAGGTATSGSNTSVPALVLSRYGVEVECSHERFTEPGWSFQGVCDVHCGDCEDGGPFVIYRKPYQTSQGSYRYWAIVCLTCRTASSLKDFATADHAVFRAWDTSVNVVELAPIDAEEAHAEPVAAPAAPGHREVPAEPADSLSTAEEADLDQLPPADAADTITSPSSVAVPSTRVPLDPAVLAAAQAEYDASSGQIRMVDVGPIRRDEIGEPNVLRVSSPALDLTDLPPGELYVAVPPGEGDRYPVRLAYASVTEAVVTAVDEVPQGLNLHLYLVVDPSHVAKAFLDYLKGCAAPGLASVLSEGGPLSASGPEELGSLNAQQRLAAGGLTSPGVSVIWGPPGTGKTRVIGEAVAALYRRGASVAVVSSTNVAVDQALLHVARVAGPTEPGEILRVGHPSIPEVVEHETLTVSKAVRAKNRVLIEELGRHQDDLKAARAAMAELDAERLDRLLSGYTPSSIAELAARATRLTRRAAVEHQMEAATSQLDDLRREWTSLGHRYDAARERSAEFADSIGLLEDEREIAFLSKKIDQRSDQLAQLERRIQEALGERQLKRRRLLKELNEVRSQTELSAKAFTDRRAEHLARIEEAAVRGITPSLIRIAQSEEAAAEIEWHEAKTRVLSSESALRDLQNEAHLLASVPALDERENKIAELIDERGGVKPLIDAARSHQATARSLEQRIKELSSKIERIQAELQKQEEAIVADARVVGTTLAQLVLHRGLVPRAFDHVVVDEASAALPPYVYAAMTKARVGCALVGDFEQNGPITRCKEASLTPGLRQWLAVDPFERLGITNAEAAASSQGCVVLRDQYRFGDRTMELANSVAYGGLLRHGRDRGDISADDPEVVVVDTSPLKDAAVVQSDPSATGRWWAVGAALSYELARRHSFEGVGVVTPYRRQMQLTRAVAHNNSAAAGMQIGTAHQFQGREFPVVIVDLVEDGTGTSWVARANRRSSSWARTGVRIFNVAVTRNAGRLYIITNAGSVRAARTGPLAELNRLAGSNGFETWDARSVLDGSMSLLSSARSLGAAHEPPRLLDGEEFYPAFLDDAANARERVVIFSPFLAEARLVDVLPVLEDLVHRGVKVTVLTKSAAELWAPRLLDVLRSSGVVVQEREGMHEKVVIIDRHLTYIGSLNALSNTGKTGEVMLRLEGSAATERIALWMHAVARAGSRGRR